MSDKNHNFVLKREAAGIPFTADLDGKTLTLAPIHDLDQFELAEIFADPHGATMVEFRVSVLTLAADDENLAILRSASLKGKEIEALYSAYMAHTGTVEGESAPSVD